MRGTLKGGLITLTLVLALAGVQAQTVKVDLSRETVGKTPTRFEPMVGTWIVAQDGPDKVIKVDGSPWKTSQDNPTRLLIDTARKLYGTANEALMDNAKQFAYYPVAIARDVTEFANGTISVKFKTMAGDLDRCSGILFNVKPNGDWLTIRYNDTEQNIVLWEFHNGMRRSVRRGPESAWPLDRNDWHELKMTVNGADFKAFARRQAGAGIHARVGARPRPQRRGAQSRPDPREQPGPAAANRRTRRAVVEDRQHELLQRLRRDAAEVDCQHSLRCPSASPSRRRARDLPFSSSPIRRSAAPRALHSSAATRYACCVTRPRTIRPGSTRSTARAKRFTSRCTSSIATWWAGDSLTSWLRAPARA